MREICKAYVSVTFLNQNTFYQIELSLFEAEVIQYMSAYNDLMIFTARFDRITSMDMYASTCVTLVVIRFFSHHYAQIAMLLIFLFLSQWLRILVQELIAIKFIPFIKHLMVIFVFRHLYM